MGRDLGGFGIGSSALWAEVFRHIRFKSDPVSDWDGSISYESKDFASATRREALTKHVPV